MPSDPNDPSHPEPDSTAVIRRQQDLLKTAVLALCDVVGDLNTRLSDLQRQIDILSHPATETHHDPRD